MVLTSGRAVGLLVALEPDRSLSELSERLLAARPALNFQTVLPEVAREAALRDPPELIIVDGRGDDDGLSASLVGLRTITHAPIVVILGQDLTHAEAVLASGADELSEPSATALKMAIGRAEARRKAAMHLTRTFQQENERLRQQRLRKYNELLRTLAKQRATDDLATQLHAITEAATRSMEVARVGVWLFDAEHTRIKAQCIYDVRTGQHEQGPELAAEAFPEYFSALEEERVIIASDARSYPTTRGFAAGYLTQHGITSLLDAPIRVGGRVLGVLCHEHVGPSREFTDEDQSVAGSLADFVALAIESHEHGRAEHALLSSNKQLEEARRIEAVGRLAGGVAHDFNNVITVVSSYAFLLAKKLDKNDALQGPVAEIGKAAERAADITRKLLALTRRDPVAPRVFDLNLVVRGMEMFLRRLIGEHIALKIEIYKEPLILRADPGQVEQIILNLAINARDAAGPEGGNITIRTRKEAANKNKKAPKKLPCVLEVEDKGVGMTSEVKARIFEPFFTTKEVGRGSGLGLFTVWGAVDQMGATIEVASAPKRGSCFTVRFTEAPPEAARASITLDKTALLGTEKLLLVEDEPQVREVTTLILRDLGYRVFAASNIDEALECAKREKTFDLLVSDIVMPRASGPVVAARLRELVPDLKILFITGYSKEMLSGYDASLGSTLPKPFTAEQIGKKVREVLDEGKARVLAARS
jgi:signal transduction histidine kinase/ActR/RegA family two-component response regulator